MSADARDATAVAAAALVAAVLTAAMAGVAAAPAPPSGTPAGQTPAGTAALRGRVVAADTGLPVRMAAVSLASVERGRWDATTDEYGFFEFTALPAGRFTIRVSKAGFVATVFGAPGPRGARPAPLDLRDGQRIDRGDLALPRGGVIAGRVFDNYGDPVADASVAAFRSQYAEPGIRRLVAARTVQTNDLGDFRIYGLAPGRYYLVASLRTLQVAAAASEGSPAQQYAASSQGVAPTFYPGTAVASDALPLDVAAGGEAAVPGLRLLSVPLARVSGVVIDSAGRPATGVVVMLNSARADGALLFSMNMTEVDAGGRFTIVNVAPGDYRIDVESKAAIEAVATTGGTGALAAAGTESASVPVTVAGQDLEGLVVRTGRGFRMSGRVVVDGVTPEPAALARMRVDAFPVIQGQGISGALQARGAAVGGDGRFAIEGVSGTRLIRVSGLPAGWALKAVVAYGMDVTDAGLDMRNQDAGAVDVVVTARPTGVTGQVVDDRGLPIRDCHVTIFSEDSRRWTARLNRFVTSARPDGSGRFRVAGLPAGRYLAVAVEALEEGEWAEPGHLERLRASATPFSLADGETKTLTLTLTARR